MDWVPMVSLIATPTIVALYAFWQRRWDHQNEERRELRAVLDDAARELNRATRGAEMLQNHYKEGVGTSTQMWEQARLDFRALLDDTRTARDRLAIRLGMQSEVFRNYGEALNCLDAYRVAITDDAENGVPYSSGRIGAKHAPLTSAHLSFLQAARARAGSEDQRPSRATAANHLDDSV